MNDKPLQAIYQTRSTQVVTFAGVVEIGSRLMHKWCIDGVRSSLGTTPRAYRIDVANGEKAKQFCLGISWFASGGGGERLGRGYTD